MKQFCWDGHGFSFIILLWHSSQFFTRLWLSHVQWLCYHNSMACDLLTMQTDFVNPTWTIKKTQIILDGFSLDPEKSIFADLCMLRFNMLLQTICLAPMQQGCVSHMHQSSCTFITRLSKISSSLVRRAARASSSVQAKTLGRKRTWPGR